jgi:hypothetical protein
MLLFFQHTAIDIIDSFVLLLRIISRGKYRFIGKLKTSMEVQIPGRAIRLLDPIGSCGIQSKSDRILQEARKNPNAEIHIGFIHLGCSFPVECIRI